MASNPTTTPSLLIVKNHEDDTSLSIQSRMGMTVPEFMRRLRDPQAKAPLDAEVLRSNFIWPKHTDYEIIDPTSAVYQRDRNDCSWSLRFRALGCYHPLPTRTADLPELPPVPRTPPLLIHAQVLDEHPIIKNATHLKPSVNGEQWKSLLKSRASTNSLHRLPSENITAEQHLQLEEDLQLSDSEDEQNQSDPRGPSDKSSRPSSRLPQGAHFQTSHPIESRVRSSGNQHQPTDHLSRPVPVERLINECGHIPPPFVSPLSIMGDDSFECEPTNTVAQFDNEVIVQSDSTDQKESTLLCRPIEKPEPGDTLPSSNAKPETLNSLKINASSPGIERELHNHLSSERLTDRSDQDTLVSSPVRSRHYDHPTQPVRTKRSAFEQPEIKPLSNVGIQRDFVKRLLAESAAVLTAKQRCLVTGLSPAPEGSWKPNLFSSDKENTLVSKPITPNYSKIQKDRVSASSTQSNSHVSSSRKSMKRVQPRSVPVDVQSTKALNKSSEFSDIKSGNASFEQTAVSKLSSPTHSSFASSVTVTTKQQPVCVESDNKPRIACISPETVHANASKALHFVQDETHSTQISTPLDNASVAATIDCSRVLDDSSGCTNLKALEEAKPQSILFSEDKEITEITGSTDASDRVSMPPPESASAKAKRFNIQSYQVESKCDTTAPVPNEADSIKPCTFVSENTSSPDRPEKVQVKPVQRYSPCVPFDNTLRALPAKRWLFSDVALAKARSKIQSIIQHFNANKQEDQQALLEKIRTTLTSFGSGSTREVSNENTNIQGRKTRSRPLTGVLLVPPGMNNSVPSQQSQPVAPLQPSSIKEPNRVDACIMTSPLPTNTAIFASVGVQYISPSPKHSTKALLPSGLPNTLVPGAGGSKTAGSPSGVLSECVTCRSAPRKHNVSSPSATESIVNSRFLEAQDLLLAIEEENRIQDTTVDHQLHMARECNSEASQCWKSLVGVISDTQSGTSNRNLYHLLRLDCLHRYPVQLLNVVRHFVCAAHLLEQSGEFERAAKILAEASGQIDHINRRMHRVEAKLIKRRIRSEKHADQTVTANDPSPRARRDAGWMHLWYYALSRVRSILSFQEYRLRTQLAESLHNEVEEELAALQLPANEDEQKKDKSLPITSTTLPTATLQRLRRLIQLQGMVRRATIDWEEADKLAVNVPPWLSDTEPQMESVEPKRKIDGDIARTVGGAHICGWQTRTGTLLRFLDGIVKVHEVILGQLKATPNEVGSQLSDQLNQSASDSGCNAVKPPQVDESKPEVPNLSQVEHTDKPSPSTQTTSYKSRVKQKAEVQSLRSDAGNVTRRRSRDHGDVTKTGPSPVSAQLTCFTGLDNPEPKEKRGRKRQLLPSDDHRLWDNNNQPALSPTTSTATNTDADSESITSSVTNEPNLIPDRSISMPVKNKKSNKTRVPGKRKSQLDECERVENVHGNESHHSTKSIPVDLAKVQHPSSKHISKLIDTPDGCVTSTPTRNGVRPSDTFSPEYPPSSPSPPRNRRRSKSLAPASTTRGSPTVASREVYERIKRKKPRPVRDIGSDSNDSEDTAYQPKRVRAADSKPLQNDFSDSESHRSSSPPVPSYRPSIPSPTLKVARNARSASVGRTISVGNNEATSRSANSTMSASQNSTSDSMGYSPTKQVMVNGTREKSDQSDIPVYRVSRITRSPQHSTMGSVNGNRPPSSSSDASRATSMQRSATFVSTSYKASEDKVPSFYARWKNEPLDQFTSVPKPSKRQHIHR